MCRSVLRRRTFERCRREGYPNWSSEENTRSELFVVEYSESKHELVPSYRDNNNGYRVLFDLSSLLKRPSIWFSAYRLTGNVFEFQALPTAKTVRSLQMDTQNCCSSSLHNICILNVLWLVRRFNPKDHNPSAVFGNCVWGLGYIFGRSKTWQKNDCFKKSLLVSFIFIFPWCTTRFGCIECWKEDVSNVRPCNSTWTRVDIPGSRLGMGSQTPGAHPTKERLTLLTVISRENKNALRDITLQRSSILQGVRGFWARFSGRATTWSYIC